MCFMWKDDTLRRATRRKINNHGNKSKRLEVYMGDFI